MIARLLAPALVLALIGCIPTGKKCNHSDESVSATDCCSVKAESAGCCTEEESPSCCSVSKKSAPVVLKTVTYDGLMEAVKGQKGKVVVVDVWASYCLPCKKEFPQLVELQKKYADQGVVCISVSVDEEKDGAAALAFLQKANAAIPNYRLDEEVSFWQEKWDLKGIPAVFVFGRDGKRAAKLTNDDPDNQFSYDENVEPLVKKLLASEKK